MSAPRSTRARGRVLGPSSPLGVGAGGAVAKLMASMQAFSVVATVNRTLGVGTLGFDTSENLTAANYATLAGQGHKFGTRYVPLANQSHTAYGVIQPSEYAAALATPTGGGAKLGMMLVQFSRSGPWTTQQFHDDGEVGAAYALSLGHAACLWGDFGTSGNANTDIACLNAWYSGAVTAGYAGAMLGGYFEPGTVLSSTQLYGNLAIARYWRTGAQIPNVATRGYQFIQLWPGNRQPAPGIVIDYDVACGDYLGSYPVAAFAA